MGVAVLLGLVVGLVIGMRDYGVQLLITLSTVALGYGAATNLVQAYKSLGGGWEVRGGQDPADLLHGITFAIHAVGSTYWIDHLINRYADHDGHWRRGRAIWVLMSTGIVLLVLHFLEALAWAIAYFFLPQTPQLESFEDALYFSIVTFTTLGYGDITLDRTWRLLSGAEAVNGILLAGWSTAVLFTVVQRVWRLGHRQKEKE